MRWVHIRRSLLTVVEGSPELGPSSAVAAWRKASERAKGAVEAGGDTFAVPGGYAFADGPPKQAPAAMLAMSAGGVQSVLLMSGKSRWQLLNKLSALVLALILH